MTQVPLAEVLRPQRFEDFAGIEALDPYLVAQMREGRGRIPSLIMWGPPGSGKTTLAKLIGRSFDCEFVELSAVLAGVKDIREVVEQAKEREKPTLLFVDEIHRFNKGQQDAFLPHVESGAIALVGATTENPSFYLTGALLSRCRVVALQPLSDEALLGVCRRGEERSGVGLSDGARAALVRASGGDGRRLLNLLEAVAGIDSSGGEVSEERVQDFLASINLRVYDRDGEEHYNIASALIKSMRGSDESSVLFWLARMIEAGDDPRFIARRLIVFASEDVGLADASSLATAVAAAQAVEHVGLPEARYNLAHAVMHLSRAPKSRDVVDAISSAREALLSGASIEVPEHLRDTNSPHESVIPPRRYAQ